MDSEQAKVLGREWIEGCFKNLPQWDEIPDEINIPVIVRLYNLFKTFDMLEYGKDRYNMLGGEGGIWFPGNKAGNIAEFADQVVELCESRNYPFADKLPDILAESHKIFNVDKSD